MRTKRKPETRPVPEAVVQPKRPVQPDWQEYFNRFMAAHGQDGYVQDEGRLIFSDGWTCSADDYAGPYTEPPRDFAVLRDLKVRFWRRRYNLIKVQRDDALNELSNLVDLQKRMPGELMAKGPVNWDADAQAYVRIPSQPVDWETLTMTLNNLDRLTREAEQKLLNLGERL